MASKQSSHKKCAKAKFDSHQVILRPYLPLNQIYHCYAHILKADKLPSFFPTEINLVYPSTMPTNEFLALDNFLLIYASKKQDLRINVSYVVNSNIDFFPYL